MQEDFASTDPEEEMAKTEASQKLEGLTALLSEREQDIITRRFYNDETLKSIGKTYGVSRERIRQLEAIALDKLRIIMEVREKV